MKACVDVFYIRTKKSPIMLYCGDGIMSDEIEDIQWYESEEYARLELEKLDESGEYCVGKGEWRIAI